VERHDPLPRLHQARHSLANVDRGPADIVAAERHVAGIRPSTPRRHLPAP
jgi:hypothetical protein